MNCMEGKLLARYVTEWQEEEEEEEGGLCVLAGSPIDNCRFGIDPEITRMWGKGVSITLARKDQFIYNLGLDL